MPVFRPDVRELAPYVPGRPIADVAAELGYEPAEIVKLASNENPLPPISAVQEVMRREISGVNRYPDNEARLLRAAVADHLDVDRDQIWVGGGSSELLRVTALALGGPGTAAVYAWPSFIIYRMGSVLAMTERIEVPLDREHRHDIQAMADALTEHTTLVYVCNPNNPTGSFLDADAVAQFIDAVPERVMVLVDEAYHEFVMDPAHRSAIPHAISRPNVMVLRTFSKIHGLASLRVGYAVSRAENIVELRKAQAPFTVTSVGQAAAVESLRHQSELSMRAKSNADERARIEAVLQEQALSYVPSHANFVFFSTDGAPDTSRQFLERGIIVRAISGGWVRVTVGTSEENDRLVEAIRALKR